MRGVGGRDPYGHAFRKQPSLTTIAYRDTPEYTRAIREGGRVTADLLRRLNLNAQ